MAKRSERDVAVADAARGNLRDKTLLFDNARQYYERLDFALQQCGAGKLREAHEAARLELLAATLAYIAARERHKKEQPDFLHRGQDTPGGAVMLLPQAPSEALLITCKWGRVHRVTGPAARLRALAKAYRARGWAVYVLPPVGPVEIREA